jgi:hypothetical protein
MYSLRWNNITPVFQMKGYFIMANAFKEAIREKIEIIDQLDETTSKKGFNYRLLIPAALIIASATTGAFFVVRRVLKHKEA